jgi:hypothetical protein
MSRDLGTWAEERQHKYLIGLRVTAEERLDWLEEMLAIALAAGALPKPRDAWGQELPPGEAASRARGSERGQGP